MVTRAGLKEIGEYADQVGLCKDVMIPRNADGTLGEPTSVIKDVHRTHLTVGWTSARRTRSCRPGFRSSANPAEHGDLTREIQVFLEAGMDHLFTDQPDLGVQAVTTCR